MWRLMRYVSVAMIIISLIIVISLAWLENAALGAFVTGIAGLFGIITAFTFEDGK